MNFELQDIILIGAILLFLSVIASRMWGRLGVPALILFLGIGMLAGSEGIGGIYFDNYKFAQSLGIIALTFILFAGGLDTKWDSVRPVAWQGIVLSSVGVIITAFTIGIFVHFVFSFSFLESLLLGAIVSSTDAAAVFSILRSRSIALKGNLRPLLELESGSNDPMAYILTISVTYLMINANGSADYSGLALIFIKQVIIGGAIGLGMGYLMPKIINRAKLDYEGLYPVLILSMVFFTYAAADVIGGNGFLAVYISAIMLGRKNFIHRKSMIRFYDGMGWLMQIMMFITLGLLVFPKQLLPVAGTGFLVAFFIIFFARPIAVFLSTIFFKISFREKLLISWVGLRGAAPILFATYPVIAGVERSEFIFNLVFFIVLTSVIVQGTTLPIVSKWLRLAELEIIKYKLSRELEFSENISNELIEIDLPEDSPSVNKRVVDIKFPKDTLIVLINRKGAYITPRGTTLLETGDKLLFMINDPSQFEAINKSLGIKL